MSKHAAPGDPARLPDGLHGQHGHSRDPADMELVLFQPLLLNLPEPPGQFFDSTLNAILRSWLGRLHRVVRQRAY